MTAKRQAQRLVLVPYKRVAGRFSLPAPTPPRVRVRTGRFPIAEQQRSINPSTSTTMLLRLARLAGLPGQGTLPCQGWLLTASPSPKLARSGFIAGVETRQAPPCTIRFGPSPGRFPSIPPITVGLWLL